MTGPDKNMHDIAFQVVIVEHLCATALLAVQLHPHVLGRTSGEAMFDLGKNSIFIAFLFRSLTRAPLALNVPANVGYRAEAEDEKWISC